MSVVAASAADDAISSVSGEVSLGGRFVDVDGSKAKFNEFRDLKEGIFGNIFLNNESAVHSLSLEAENIGLDNQSYKLSGARWGVLKYSVYYNETPHNFTYDARTFYGNPGSSTLDYGFSTVPADTNVWTPFNYSIKRKDLGATVEFQLNSPFYAALSANELRKEGLYPIGAPSGVFRTSSPGGSPFGNVVEMPLAVDHTTKNASVEFGYKTKALFLSVTGMISSFENSNKWLNFRNPYVTSQTLFETVSLQPDNDYYKIKFTGLVKLPLDSALSVTSSYAKMTSDTDLLNTIWASTSTTTGPPVYSFTNLGLNDPVFNGTVINTNFAAALTSNPTKQLSTKVYYKYARKDNKSDLIEYSNGTSVAHNELFEYKKNNAGVEVSYKFLKNLKATAGYDYLVIDRERFDIPETTDNTYFVQVKYSPLDFLGGRIKYQRLNRDGHHEAPDAALLSESTAFYIENFLRRFDAASKKQDMLKASIDLTPVEALDFSLEYAYKKDNYNETILGMTKYTRNEFIIDATYAAKFAKLYGFFDYEEIKTDQSSRAIGSNLTNTSSFDPSSAPTASNFNWDVKLKEKNYMFGIGVEVPVIPNTLSVSVQYDYQKSNGNADFTSQVLASTVTQETIDLPEYDDYTQKIFSAKIKYNYTKNLKFILGYLYDKYTYSDVEYSGYRNVITAGGQPNTYLTGAYNAESYKANVVYVKAVYRF